MTGRKKCLVDSVSRAHVQKKKKPKKTRRNNTIFCFSLLRCIYANTRHKPLLVKNGTLQNLQVY